MEIQRHPTDAEIMIALCCGEKCRASKGDGLCHRHDFASEMRRVKDLLVRTAAEPATETIAS